jgi:hypothetical protein
METKEKNETIAVRCWVEDGRVWPELADQRLVGFPASKYPLLSKTPQNLLEKVSLRLDGLALRWEELDEDIWVDDAVCGRFPRPRELAA